MTAGRPKTKTLNEMQIMGERKDRMPQNPVERIGDRLTCFDGLGEVGKAIWNYLEPMLYNNGTLDTCDSLAFYSLCICWEKWYGKLKEIKEKGEYATYQNKHGEISYTATPWYRQERELWRDLQTALKEFGLTPVSRRNVEKIARGGEKDIFEGLTSIE